MTTIDERVAELNEAVRTFRPVLGLPVDILEQATSVEQMKRLGEMRLLELWPDGILGITALGRSVLIGLLFAINETLPEDFDPKVRAVLRFVAAFASKALAVEEYPEDVRNQVRDFAASTAGLEDL